MWLELAGALCERSSNKTFSWTKALYLFSPIQADSVTLTTFVSKERTERRKVYDITPKTGILRAPYFVKYSWRLWKGLQSIAWREHNWIDCCENLESQVKSYLLKGVPLAQREPATSNFMSTERKSVILPYRTDLVQWGGPVSASSKVRLQGCNFLQHEFVISQLGWTCCSCGGLLWLLSGFIYIFTSFCTESLQEIFAHSQFDNMCLLKSAPPHYVFIFFVRSMQWQVKVPWPRGFV